MERQLRRAIRQDKLSVLYQPVIQLADGRVVGAEALVRWIDEAGKDVRPDVFVALAEERGFVGEITRLVLRRAIEDLGQVLMGGDFRLNVNIAASDLIDPQFFDQLEQYKRQDRIMPFSVGLELTERSTVNDEAAIDAISRLKRDGYSIYIDDFGNGFSSLAYLHRLDTTAIKMDKLFTQTVGTEAATVSIVPQILQMARQLNQLVVVEGIETKEQAEYFRTAGDGILGQGWFFGGAVSANELQLMIGNEIVNY